ncbi:MAG: DUF4340 domain-containing protein [Firmicutes bacterium]|nr:DUF4340 domain-containing protein [Bacillota bacterium]
MKKFWLTYLLLAVFVALGAYVYLSRPATSENGQGAAAGAQILKLKQQDVVQISLAWDGQSAELRRAAGRGKATGAPGASSRIPAGAAGGASAGTETGWRLVKPVDARADETVVGSLLSTFTDLKASDKVAEKAGNLAQYGLNAPQRSLTLRLRSGKTYTLLVGGQSPLGTDYYVMLKGSSPVYTLPGSDLDVWPKDTAGLRDHRVVMANADQVTALDVTYNGRRLVMSKGKDGVWVVKEPYPGKKPSSTDVQSLLWDLTWLNADGFVNDHPSAADLHRYGLDQPWLAADVSLPGGGAAAGRVRVLVGKQLSASAAAALGTGSAGTAKYYYVKNSSDPTVYAVSTISSITGDLDRLLKPPAPATKKEASSKEAPAKGASGAAPGQATGKGRQVTQQGPPATAANPAH